VVIVTVFRSDDSGQKPPSGSLSGSLFFLLLATLVAAIFAAMLGCCWLAVGLDQRRAGESLLPCPLYCTLTHYTAPHHSLPTNSTLASPTSLLHVRFCLLPSLHNSTQSTTRPFLSSRCFRLLPLRWHSSPLYIAQSLRPLRVHTPVANTSQVE
jgi:hypothetical protein